MPRSDFVYEEGSDINVGTHGDHDLLYHEGDPVPDTGDSTLVYEEGTGLGGGKVLVYRQACGDTWDATDFAADVEARLGLKTIVGRDSDGDRIGDFSGLQHIVVFSGEQDTGVSYTSDDLDVVESVHDAGGGVLLCVEDDGNSDITEANSVTQRLVGESAFELTESGYSWYGVGTCLTGSPSLNHPVFSGISNLYGRGTEGNITGGTTITWSGTDDSYNPFGYYDPTGAGRIWIDASFPRFCTNPGGDNPDEGYLKCDTKTYTLQTMDWLNGDI